MSENELMLASAMPAMGIEDAVARYEKLAEFIRRVMKPGLDYGVIPSTDKPTLLLPGGEKLAMFFGLAARFEFEEMTEDWTGKDHGGEPLFYYRVRCTLWRGDHFMGEGVGSCNSREAKYRWRKAERVCPSCGKENIRRSKNPPKNNPNAEPGWFCWQKTNGCGAEFAANDPAIMSQEVGRVPNSDIYDLVNTLQKIAQKRGFLSSVKTTVNASAYFTVDIGDDDDDEHYEEAKDVTPNKRPAPQQNGKHVDPNDDAPITPEMRRSIYGKAREVYSTPAELDAFKESFYERYNVTSTNSLTRAQAKELNEFLDKRLVEIEERAGAQKQAESTLA